MLADKGYVAKQKIKPIGRGKRGEPTWYEVTYDKEYVLTKLAVNLLQSFRFRSLHHFLELMIEVWEKWLMTQYELSPNEITEIVACQQLLTDAAPPEQINLSNLKTRKLHHKSVYFVDELMNELSRQGYLVIGNQQENNE